MIALAVGFLARVIPIHASDRLTPIAPRETIVLIREVFGRDNVVRDGDVRLAFAQAADGGLTSLVLSEHGREVFIFSTPVRSGLWKIDLFDLKTQRAVTLQPSDARNITPADAKGERATRWTEFKKNGEKYDLSVVQRWTQRADRDLALTLAVTNNSPWALSLVHFPDLKFRVQRELEAELKLVIPNSDGRLIRAPFDSAHRRPWRYAYPSRGIMQFLGCYANKAGFMIVDEDSRGYEKEYFLNTHLNDRTIEVAVKRWPSAPRAAGGDFTMDYSTVIKPIAGDWFAMATAYRTWALTQPWARYGPTERNDRIPHWYKEAPAVFVVHSNDATEPFSALPAKTAALLKALDYPQDAAAPLFWYSWQAYRPDETVYADASRAMRASNLQRLPSANVHSGVFFPARDGLKEAIAELEKARVKPVVFMNTRLFDQANPGAEKWRPMAIKSPTGQVEIYGAKHPLWDMCRSTEAWQHTYGGLAERLIRDYGAKGIYLDSMGGMSKRCFDPAHRHDLGGGRYQALAMHDFCSSLGPLKDKYGEMIFIDENGPEYLMDVLDGTLSHYNITHDKIPLRQAVYHDYWLSSGRSLSRGELAVPNLFEMSAASLFACGQQIGRIEVTDAEMALPSHRGKMAYLGSLIRAKYQARRWLNKGQMLSPPELEGIPDITTEYRPEPALKEPVVIKTKAVFASCWRARDGSVALVLTNSSAQPVSGSVIVALQSYFPELADCKLTDLATGEERGMHAVSDQLRLKLALPAHGTSVQIFTPGGTRLPGSAGAARR